MLVVRAISCVVGSLLISSACGQRGLKPTDADRVPEVSRSGVELRAAPTFTFEVPDRATVAGFMVDLEAAGVEAALEARGVHVNGRPGAWVPAEVTWAENELRVLRADLGVAAATVEVRVADPARVRFLVASAVVPMPKLRRSATIGVTRSALSASLAAAGIKSRADWGARPTRCSSLNTTKTRMAVHHTVTPASSSGGHEARLRQIQSFHMDTRGWCDVGYHFLVTTDGNVWEAREARFVGAHVSNHNTNNIGVSFVGCFHPGDATCDQAAFQPNVPPDVMIQGGGSAIGALSQEYGITVNATNVKGHRDHSGASTSCPGNALHSRLGDLRAIANDATPAPTTGGAIGVVFDGSVTSGPSDPGNVRVTDATVTCSCGESQQVRSSDGLFNFDLPPGTYTFTAEAPGFASTSRDITVTANSDSWGSIGVIPVETAIDLVIQVKDGEEGTAVEAAEVSMSMIGVKATDAAGAVTFEVEPGEADLTITAEGFETHEEHITFAADTTLTFDLTRVMVPEPPEPPQMPKMPPEMPVEDPVVDEMARDDVSGGCGCSAGGEMTGAGSLLLLLGGLLCFRPRARVRRRQR